MSILELRKIVQPEVILGKGAFGLVGRYLNLYRAEKVLLVSDKGVVEAGWTGKIEQQILESGLQAYLYTDVTANPRDLEVEKAADIFQRNSCNAIVAVGGGSPMDLAKGAGILAMNEGTPLQYEGVDQVAKALPLMICIPTTGGTSADVSQFAIISIPEQRRKIAIISKAIVPDVALIDPLPLTSMDPFLTACTGLDALTHAVEAYMSNAASVATDIHALKAVELIKDNLLKTILNPDDLESRAQVMTASYLAGIAFSNASLGAVHAMAHSLGGVYDLPHGECNAILLDKIISFNADSVGDKIDQFCSVFQENKPIIDRRGRIDYMIKKIRELKSNAGISHGLNKLGVKAEHIPDLVPAAASDPCMITNPRRLSNDEIGELYEKSL